MIAPGVPASSATPAMVLIPFIALALALYGAMHAYLFAKLRDAGLAPRWRRLLIPCMALMTVAPFAGRILDRTGVAAWSGVLVSFPAFLWMAVLFWFCVLALLIDLWNAAVRALAVARPACARARLAPRKALAGIGFAIAAATVWGAIEAKTIRVRELHVAASQLPAGAAPVRLLQISDLHLSTYRGARLLGQVLRRAQAARPDIVVCTGDLIDSPYRDLQDLAERFRTLQPPLGMYSIFGNHEYYAGVDNANAFHGEAGFHVLRGEALDVGPYLRLAGVDDPAGRYTGAPCREDELPLLGSGAAGRFVVLLKHQPRLRPDALGRFDLQLSGHTHGGQVFPFHWLVRALYPRFAGSFDTPTRSRLYVSRGAGTWGPPLRLFAPPELTLIRIEPARGFDSPTRVR
jgi:uncharacterized protein